MLRIDNEKSVFTAVNSDNRLTCSSAGTWKTGATGEQKTTARHVAVAYTRGEGVGRPMFLRPCGLAPRCPPSSVTLEPSLKGAEPCLENESPRNDPQSPS